MNPCNSGLKLRMAADLPAGCANLTLPEPLLLSPPAPHTCRAAAGGSLPCWRGWRTAGRRTPVSRLPQTACCRPLSGLRLSSHAYHAPFKAPTPNLSADFNHSLLDSSGASRWAASVYFGGVACLQAFDYSQAASTTQHLHDSNFERMPFLLTLLPQP